MYAKHKDMDLGEFSVEVDFHTNREQQERIERRVIRGGSGNLNNSYKWYFAPQMML